jgi:WD40 repeat protein
MVEWARNRGWPRSFRDDGWRLVGAILVGGSLITACGRTVKPDSPPSRGGVGSSGEGGTGTGEPGEGGDAGRGFGGVTLSEAPPFSVPVASLAALEACESLAAPEPVGFLGDGRPVVVQRTPAASAPAGDLVRAWDPAKGELETLVVTAPGATPQLTDSGRRLFELSSPLSHWRGYRYHDLGAGSVTSSSLIPVTLLGVSGDGSFVLDDSLRRLTAQGDLDFDFAPLLPENVRAQARHAALSFTGDAIAVPWREVDDEKWHVAIAYEDGHSADLAEAPPLERCCNLFEPNCGCSVAFSDDGRHLLGFGYENLRVWDTATAEIELRVEGPQVGRGSFLLGTDRVLVANDTGATEHSLDGSEPSPTSLDDARFVSGPGPSLGYLRGSLVVTERDRVAGRWQQPRQSWASAVAVTDDAAFAIVSDGDFDGTFRLMVARYENDVAGPTAVFRPQEAQSEWVGQIELSPDGRRVAVVFPDSVRVLDATSLELLVTLPTGAGAVAWSPDGRYVVTSPDLHYRDAGRPAYEPRKSLDFWDAASGQLAASYATPVHTQAFAFSADGTKLVASGQEMKELRPDPGSTSSVRQFVSDGGARSFTLDSVTGDVGDSALGAILGSTREVVATDRGLFRVSTGELASLLPPRESEHDAPSRVVLAPDASVGALLTGAAIPGRLFTTADAQRTTAAPFEGPWVSLAFAPGGRRLIVGEAIYCGVSAP